jgi:hypothetical protein
MIRIEVISPGAFDSEHTSYLHEKEIIKLLINFLEFFASFPCTMNRNWNRIPNTVPVPVLESPNECGSDRFRNPGSSI